MRIAALYDIHGNLPALEAVLDDVRRAGADRIVVGGDVVPGPMPRETLERLLALDIPVQFIHGNCELAVLAQLAADDPAAVTYWGTVSGRPLPEHYLAGMRWSAEQVRDHAVMFTKWPRTLRIEITGLGPVLFCHSTPRSETEVFTRLTDEARLAPVIGLPGISVVVCGHTHMQFERQVGKTRVVNAGSVGAPFGETGAFWALLGPGVMLRRTMYDLEAAAERIRATGFPQAEEEARNILQPPDEAEMLERYGKVELT
jgi:predicted phosphodiesterase